MKKDTQVIQNCVPWEYISAGLPNSSIAVMKLKTILNINTGALGLTTNEL